MNTTLQDVLRSGFWPWVRWRGVSGRWVSWRVLVVVWRLMHCRRPEMGTHSRRCPAGHFESVGYNSCKDRCCPQCSWTRGERWLDRQRSRLLDCPHFHVIFTIPSELRPLWRRNARCFGNLLLRAAGQTLMELLTDGKYCGGCPGVLLALHTWNQRLQLHPHVHALVTGGGLDASGRWLSTRKAWLLPRRVVMAKYRGKLRALLLEALAAGELRLPDGLSAAKARSILNRFGVTRTHVKILEQYAHGRGVVTYLARYLTGGPLSNRRVLPCNDGQVRFRYQDRREVDSRTGRYKVRSLRLPMEEFIDRWVQHIPPKRFVSIRYWGLYASAKSQHLATARRLLCQVAAAREEPASWQELADRLGIGHAASCPVCGAELIYKREEGGRARP